MSAVPLVARVVSGIRSLPRPSSSRRYLIAVGGLILIVLAVWTLRPAPGRRAASTAAHATAVVEKRDFVRILRLNGVLEAARFTLISAPRIAGQAGGGPLIITKLVPAGAAVHLGDVLVEFDPQAQMRAYVEREAEYLGLVEELKRKRADQEALGGQDEAELQKAERDVERARLDVRKAEVLPRIDAAKNAQTLEEAQARVEQLRRKQQFRDKSARADLRALEIRAERAQRAMAHAKANMERLQIRSGLEGVVVFTPMWRNNGPAEVQEGDEVRPGSSFLQVVDPQTMQVRLKVNQADLHRLKGGQAVQVFLDAYPDVKLPGKLEQIGAVGSSTFSDRVKTFSVIASIGGKEPRMMPDLSAAVDVELERQHDVLVVPRDAVLDEGEGKTSVRLADGATRSVKVAARSDHECVIASGLDVGATVLRSGEGE
jgi:multidrug efflux pump subunit AcrA (membrane-fusion protein)